MIAFMNSSPVAFYLLSSNLTMIDVNHTSIERFKDRNNRGDLLGMHLTEIVPNFGKTKRYLQYLDVIKTSIPMQIDTIKGEGPFYLNQ